MRSAPESETSPAACRGLEIRDVRKSFGVTRVLEGVTLTAPGGAATAILGTNGSGKSTLFKILMGLLAPCGGSATLDGVELLDKPLHAKADLGLGYLPQASASFADLSARDNLRAILELRLADRGARRAREAELLDLVGLGAAAERRQGSLSLGEQRRLEVAKALAGRPRVLLLDEPFSGLDPLITQSLAALFRSLADQGVTILLTDHHVAPTLAFADAVHVLAQGRVVLSGSADEVRRDPRAGALYFGGA